MLSGIIFIFLAILVKNSNSYVHSYGALIFTMACDIQEGIWNIDVNVPVVENAEIKIKIKHQGKRYDVPIELFNVTKFSNHLNLKYKLDFLNFEPTKITKNQATELHYLATKNSWFSMETQQVEYLCDSTLPG